jgi:hypothetical protein
MAGIDNKLPSKDQVVDGQFINVLGPNAGAVLSGFEYDAETQSFYKKQSQVIIPSNHNITHVENGSDAIPCATQDTGGIMCSDDKVKLDTLVQTRLGVLGFQGAGFADDGGFMQGDIILAAGTEFISLERVGNVIRFTVDSPIPLNCACEECAQIFWIQDESEPRAIRPPSCNGVMPNVTAYGEMKVYLLPESAILDPANPLALLNTKGQYPTLIFKRYDDGLTPFEAEMDMVLKRREDLTTNVGWAMTPGPTGVAECVWFMGSDSDGEQVRFELNINSEPGLLGQLLYQGHTITEQWAVITDYTPQILSTNQYRLKKWDLLAAEPKGDEFTGTNLWRYENPENSPTDPANPRQLTLDATKQLLPIGTLVHMWEFQVGETQGNRLTQAFFLREPEVSSESQWSLGAAIRFGDTFSSRREINPEDNTALTASDLGVPDVRIHEKTVWGITTFEDRLILSDDGGLGTDCTERDPSGEPINNLYVADIDSSIPGLVVSEIPQLLLGDINHDGVVNDLDLELLIAAWGSVPGDPNWNPDADINGDGVVDIRDLALMGDNFDLVASQANERPVFLWHRGNHKNTLMDAKIGMPDDSFFPPYDILLRAPVDSWDDTYMKVPRRGVFCTGPFAGVPYIIVKGMRWEDLPPQGALRILSGIYRNVVWRYAFKAAFNPFDDDAVTLISATGEVFPFDDDFQFDLSGTDVTIGSDVDPDTPVNTTAVELLRTDFTSPCARLEFSVNQTSSAESVQLQIKVGILDMTLPYELNAELPEPGDDLVRGLRPGYTVSQIMTQDGFITDGIGQGIQSDPENFKVYVGGELPAPVDGQTEKWNDITIMHRDQQVWIWWNGMIVPPSTLESAALPTPVVVNTPYYPLSTDVDVGKYAFRMWPGAIVRAFELRDQLQTFNEFTLGQLEIT